MNKRNKYLAELGLSSDAKQEDLEAAYKEMMAVWHPDRFQHDAKLSRKAENKSKEINIAYHELKNNWEKWKVKPQASSPEYSAMAAKRRKSPKKNMMENYFVFLAARLSLAILVVVGALFYFGVFSLDSLDFSAISGRYNHLEFTEDEFAPLKTEIERSLASKEEKRNKGPKLLTKAFPENSYSPLDGARVAVGLSETAPDLVRAAIDCNLERSKDLLEKGAPVDSLDKAGVSALSWASKQGCVSVAKLLISKGADVNLKSTNGFTPLTWANLHRRKRVAKLLTESGAKPVSDYWKGGAYTRGYQEE